VPSRSPEQARFMRAVAKSKKFAKKVGVSQSVGAKFMAKDKKKKRVRKYQTGRLVDAGGAGGIGAGGIGGIGAALGAGGARPRPGTPPMGFTPRGSLPTIGAPEGPARRRPTDEEILADPASLERMRRRRQQELRRTRANEPRAAGRRRLSSLLGEDTGMGFTAEEIKPKRKKKKGGTIKSYHYGGKIRARGKETKGRRKAKMIRMKGS